MSQTWSKLRNLTLSFAMQAALSHGDAVECSAPEAVLPSGLVLSDTIHYENPMWE